VLNNILTLYLNSPKAPVSAGVFYFFNIPQRPLLQSPIPGTIAINAAWRKLHQGTEHFTENNQGHTKTIPNTFLLISTLIPSIQSPITSPLIAIMDAIGSPKSHRNLVQLVRDLIEPDIKRKRQLLLPW
jgi:hypothetical protein